MPGIDQIDRIVELLDRRRAGQKLNEQETQELLHYVQQTSSAPFSLSEGDDDSLLAKEYLGTFLTYDTMQGWDILKKRILPTIYGVRPRKLPVYVKAAAVVILILGVGIIGYLTWFEAGSENKNIVEGRFQRPPELDKATLTLGDGSTIVLDSTVSGKLAMQEGAEIIKVEDGQLVYNATKSADTAMTYNTITVPRGSLYSIRLPDGTKVWLNAASSLRYPTSFTGAEREVTLTGEGYFEVKKVKEEGRSIPFRVNVGDLAIAVRGTDFNVNAYTDEPVVKTSLLQGSVELIKGGRRVSLKAGQEGSLAKSNDAFKVGQVNPEQVVAWINGGITFSGSDLEALMRIVARKYDVEVVYGAKTEEGRHEKMQMEVPRNYSLMNLLSVLNVTFDAPSRQRLSFSLEESKIVVRAID